MTDADGDGYGDINVSLPIIAGTDCDDAEPNSNPAATELINGVDDDCDGLIDQGTVAYDDDGDGYSENAGDCDDSNASTYPSAPENENGVDDDCDGLVDEGTNVYDDDGDGYSENDGDCDDSDPLTRPNIAFMEVNSQL